MSRVIMIAVGVVLCLLGSVGLLLFGPALVRLPLALIPGNSLLSPLDPYRLAAASAALMALGATIMGLIAQRDSVKLSLSGKASVALAGLMVVLGTLAILYGIIQEFRYMQSITASSLAPRANEIESTVDEMVLPAQFGFGFLVVAQALALAGACQLSPSESGRGPTTAKMAGVTYMVTGWLIAFIFIVIWFIDAQSLAVPVETSHTMNIVSTLAVPIRAINIKSVMICVCFLLQATCLAAIGLSKVRD